MKNLLMLATLLAGLGAIVMVASGSVSLLDRLVPGSVRTAAEDAGDELARIASQRPSAGDIPGGILGLRGDDSTPTATASPSATPGGLLLPQVLAIGATGGLGIALRDDCTAEARAGGAVPDDAAVTLLEHGTGRCAGWLWVASDFGDTWVRESFVFSGTPGGGGTGVAAPLPPPTATPSPSPTPTPSPTATATPPPAAEQVAVWFGDISARPGDTVSARIGGVSCASEAVLGSTLAARYFLSVSSTAPCAPTAGATVTFLLDGVPLSPTSTWPPSSTTELNLQSPHPGSCDSQAHEEGGGP